MTSDQRQLLTSATEDNPASFEAGLVTQQFFDYFLSVKRYWSTGPTKPPNGIGDLFRREVERRGSRQISNASGDCAMQSYVERVEEDLLGQEWPVKPPGIARHD
jgi:hypothetical protein